MNVNLYVRFHILGQGGTTLGNPKNENLPVSLQHLWLPQKCTQCDRTNMPATCQPQPWIPECLALSHSASPHLLLYNSRTQEEKLLPPKGYREGMSDSSHWVLLISTVLSNSWNLIYVFNSQMSTKRGYVCIFPPTIWCLEIPTWNPSNNSCIFFVAFSFVSTWALMKSRHFSQLSMSISVSRRFFLHGENPSIILTFF